METGVLALLGGLVGLFLAWQGTALLVALSPDTLPRAHEIRIDGRVLVFTLLVSIGAGLLFGLIPALKYSGLRMSAVLVRAAQGHQQPLDAAHAEASRHFG